MGRPGHKPPTPDGMNSIPKRRIMRITLKVSKDAEIVQQGLQDLEKE
jgi:hypothetical protein